MFQFDLIVQSRQIIQIRSNLGGWGGMPIEENRVKKFAKVPGWSLRSSQTEQVARGWPRQQIFRLRNCIVGDRTPNSLGRWTQTFVVTTSFTNAESDSQKAMTKLAILNPREEVEEIQDEIDEPLRCSADCCQC